MLRILVPIFLCFLGIYFAFMRFWDGFDAITGDLGDARFNALVLEHTWLWVKGQHQLFKMPMFYPSPNAYAYSDFMFGFAPIYWAFRALGFELLLSFQSWMIAGSIFNYASYFVLAWKFFRINVIGSSLAAFIFAFSLPRVTHFEHAQTNPQFFVVLSAMGALWWWREPSSKKAPWLFCLGATLQFISAFYFFWFWVWTLGIYFIYIFMNADRRAAAKNWFASATPSS